MPPRRPRSDGPTERADDARSGAGRRDRTEWAENRTEWAEERRDWAHTRTLLAKERTFSAWLRTGLAILIAGFAVARFLPEDQGDSILARLVSVALVAVGGLVLAVGYWSYRQGIRQLEAEGVRGVPRLVLVSITIVLVLATVAGVLLIL